MKHDYYTDIITFDLSGLDRVEAEVYISIDRVKANAQAIGTSFNTELLRVIFHGALHLCGFLDKTAKQKALMREKENSLLAEYNP